MSAGVHGMLPAEGLRLSDGSRPREDREVRGDVRPGLRAEVRLPHAKSHAPASSTRCELPLSHGWRMFDPPGQADAMPHLSFLAGAGREPARMEENGAVLPRD